MSAQKKREKIPESGGRRWLRSPVAMAVVAILVLLVGVGAGVMLGRRTPGLSGARSTAATAPRMSLAGGVPPALQSLAQEIEREDAPTPRLLEFAHLALDQQQLALAIPAYRRVLTRDPKNAEALTHMGLILYRANHADQALAYIDQALKTDPKYAHAHWDRAHILYEGKRDLAGAAKSLEAFLTLIPQGPDAERARALLAEVRRSGKTAKP